MASYVKFELEDGTIVYVESTDTPKGAGGFIPSRGAEQAVEQAAVSFDQSVQTIRKMATSLMQNLQAGLTEQPEEVGINFGLKASAELGSLIVSRGGMEANYNVSLRWRHKNEEGNGSGSKEDSQEEKKEEKKSAKKSAEAE
jgi:hypothetical protein